MKFNAVIEINGVKSKKSALNVLQVMLNDYEDMNPDSKEVVITLKDKCNGKDLACNAGE
jgi:hypothetical protein